jgi:hypothetical protein
MTDVISLAREAGFVTLAVNEDTWVPYLESFAQLVTQAERQRIATALQKMPLNDTANSIAIWILDGGKDVG